MAEFLNNIEQVINTPDKVYESFNEFIFSNDKKVLSKLVAKINILNLTKDVPGDIVECGVFKGSGILSWLKIKNILYPNAFKKVIGFDFFDTKSMIDSLNGDDLYKMKKLFESRNFTHTDDFKTILSDKIVSCGYDESTFELVKGDICQTSFDFVSKRPGFKISILYIDLDLNIPTLNTLNAFWNRISKGGVVVFDEYAYHQWSETIGVDKFFEDKDVQVKTLDFQSPTAYVIKK
jgi:hypothetical protein